MRMMTLDSATHSGGGMSRANTVLCPLVLMIVAISAVVPQAESHEVSMCASAEQIAAVRFALDGKEPAPLSAIATTLKTPEAVVASALPATQAFGVSATHFQMIWKSLETWDDATIFITKGSDLFEVQGPVARGEPSKRSKFFNLHREGPGLIGHLRPDLYSSIYLLEIPGTSTTLRGVVFFDQSGGSVFSVYVPGEGAPPPAAVVDQFKATSSLIRSLPSLCPGESRSH